MAFPRAEGVRASRFDGEVLDAPWRGVETEDVAVVHLHDLWRTEMI